MEPDALSPEQSPELEFVYSNESTTQQVYWPLLFSQTKIPRAANQLHTDTSGTYFTYSGDWQSLLVSKQKEGRYKNFSIKAYSGDSFKFYFSTNSSEIGVASYYAGPLTISGSYAKFTSYITESGALNNPITFTSPEHNSRIFTLPEINNIHWMRLFHKSTTGSVPYRMYQFLPRTLIQVDDLEADVIDAVTIRVSDSIVIGPNLIADKSILGQKIADGTVSGVLITDGTIYASKLSVNQLDAVAANMGNLVVNSGISIGTEGYLWAGSGSASMPTTGLKIYTTDSVSRLTTYSGGIAQVDIGSDGKLYVGSGQTLKLDSTGMTFKTAVSGVSVSLFSRVPASISTIAYPPKENLIKFHPYNFQVTEGVPTFYEDTNGSVLAFFENTELYSTHSSAYNQDRWLGSKTRIRSGWLASESGLNSMYKKTDDSYMYFESFGQHNTALKLATGKDTSQASITLSGSSLGYTQINFDAKSLWFYPEQYFTMDNPSATVTFAGATTINNTLTAGNTTISGTLDVASNFKVNNNKFTVVPGNGNTNIAGTLDVVGDVHLGTGSHTMKFDASTGNATFDGTLDVASNFTVNNNKFTVVPGNGNTTIAGTLDVASNFKVNTDKFTVVPATGNTTISGSLTVRGGVSGTGSRPFSISTTTGLAAFKMLQADSYTYTADTGAPSPLYGAPTDYELIFDGSDDVTNTSRFATYNSAISTYTLTRDIYASRVTVNVGINVVTAGFRIFATDALTVNGYLHNQGGNASGATAGGGTLGGYYKSSGAGAAGLAAGATGAGTAAPLPTAGTLVGALGGRGAAGRASTTATVGFVINKANFDLSTPALVDGGRSVVNNLASWNTRALTTATALWQMTSALGGTAGSKSAIGTAATSGAGGGGGGFMLLASPVITGSGTISVKGGNGGNAAGTGGNFGGGGGGGGGILAIITGPTNYPTATIDVSGGLGGTSVSNLISPVAAADSSTASTTATTVTLANTGTIAKDTLYILGVHIVGAVDAIPSVVSVVGAKGFMNWQEVANVTYASDAAPTRRLQVFVGILYSGYGANYSDDPIIKVFYDSAPVSARHSLDAVHNTVLGEMGWFENAPVVNTTNSATSISTDLGYVPTTNYMQYTVVARSGGTTPVAGTGNTLLNNQTVAPLLVNEVTINRQINSMSWTTAAAAAAVTIDIPIPSVAESGRTGEEGQVLIFGLD